MLAPPVPTPIGVGPQFHPKPAMHAACANTVATGRVHLELFAQDRVIIVPPRVGVRSSTCRARLYTVDPTGVVHFTAPSRLGDFFSVWGRRLAPARLLGFGGRVRLYVNGTRRTGDARRLVLRDRDEIVLEVGPYIPPHRSFLFPAH